MYVCHYPLCQRLSLCPFVCQSVCILSTQLFTDVQYSVGGLQVKDPFYNGGWINVPCNSDAFVVNIGLGMQRLSGGRLTATNHRVLHVTKERLSIPFFVEPAHDCPMAPLMDWPGHTKEQSDEWTYLQYIQWSNRRFKEYQRDEKVVENADGGGESSM